MTPRLAIVISAFLPLAALADVPAASMPADPPAVLAFYRHPEHCAYMVSPPEDASPGFIERFETDIHRAAEALQARDPSLSLTNILLQLRAGCGQVLANVK